MSLTFLSSFSSRSSRFSSSLSSRLQSRSCQSWSCRSVCACLMSAASCLKAAWEWPTYCSYSLQAIMRMARNSLCRQVLAIDFSCDWSSCSASIETFSSSRLVTPSLRLPRACQTLPISSSISRISPTLLRSLSWPSGLAWICTSLWASLTACVKDSLKKRLMWASAAGECCLSASCWSAVANWLPFILIFCRRTCRCCWGCWPAISSSILRSSAVYCASCSATSLLSI